MEYHPDDGYQQRSPEHMKPLFLRTNDSGISCATQKVLALVLLLFAFLDAPAHASETSSRFGTNLTSVVDWTTEWVFVDVFKTARDWISNSAVDGGPWGSGGPFPGYTPEGYPLLNPGQVADTPVCTHGHCPAGIYHLRFDGTGTVSLWGSVSILSQQPGEITATLTGDEVFIRILTSNAEDPVRNIRFYMPGFDDSSPPFHPLFLSTWQNMKVIRFMDWMRTNDSTQQSWSDRPQANHFTQATSKGVALEYMIRLANTSEADPWFNIPHLANDDYVWEFATLVRNGLRRDSKIYVEYSNEVWNSQFTQAAYAQERGLALGLSSNPYEAQLRFVSKRSVEIFSIFAAVFEGTDRLVRVLPAQAANPWTGMTIMDYQDAYQHADALAIAPYFGGYLGNPTTQNEVAQWTVDHLMTELRDTAVPQALSWVAANANETESRDLDLIAYEGGQHLAGHGGAENNQALTDLFITANRDRRMQDLYVTYLGGWKDKGGQTFVNFASTGLYDKWGSWGLLEYQDQNPLAAPKLRAVRAFLGLSPGGP